MHLVCISDTHMAHKAMSIPDGDVLIHAGDATSQGLSLEVEYFLAWFAAQPHPHKILIAGNHDWLFQRHSEMAAQLVAAHPGITYLEDSGVEIEGVKFWGSPWQPWFLDWAFNLPRKGVGLHDTWNRIPMDTDVLITHGPPHGVMDQALGGHHLGCEELRTRLASVRPRVHIFGHIHDSYGVAKSRWTTYVNACSCDEGYRPTHRPVVLDLRSNSVEVPGIESNVRLERLEGLQATLRQDAGESMEKILYLMSSVQIEGLHDMAEIRGIRTEALLQEYVMRGLQADLARHIRAESKPSKRPIPYSQLEATQPGEHD